MGLLGVVNFNSKLFKLGRTFGKIQGLETWGTRFNLLALLFWGKKEVKKGLELFKKDWTFLELLDSKGLGNLLYKRV